MADQNQETCNTKNSVFNDNSNFYYYYRSNNEKQKLQKIICKDLKLFYKTVCLYEKNKYNPNCADLSEHLKHFC